MGKRVFSVHTSFGIVDAVSQVFKELLPDVEQIPIVYDSLLADVRRAGYLTQAVTRRLVLYYLAAEAGGADVILNCCSSVGEAVDAGRPLVSVPIVRIDEQMARQAVQMASDIGVLATVETTLPPTTRLVQRAAVEAGRTIKIRQELCAGAMDALFYEKDAAKHDRLVLEGIRRMAAENELVVLAQGSMARLVPQLDAETAARVLSSPRGGVLKVKELLEQAR